MFINILKIITGEFVLVRENMRSALTTQVSGLAQLSLVWSRTQPSAQASEDSSNTSRELMKRVSAYVSWIWVKSKVLQVCYRAVSDLK